MIYFYFNFTSRNLLEQIGNNTYQINSNESSEEITLKEIKFCIQKHQHLDELVLL